MFLFPQSDDISRGLPPGERLGRMEKIYFGERYFFAKAYGKHEVNNEKNRTGRLVLEISLCGYCVDNIILHINV